MSSQRLILFFIFIHSINYSHAQNERSYELRNNRFCIYAGWQQAVQLENGNTDMLSFTAVKNLAINYEYIIPVSNTWAISLGVGGMINAYRYKFNVDVPHDHPLYTDHNNKIYNDRAVHYDIPTINANLNINYIKQTANPDLIFRISVGLANQLIPTYGNSSSFSVYVDSATTYTIVDVDIEDVSDKPSYFTNLVYTINPSIVYKKRWGLGLYYNYSPKVNGAGTAKLNLINYEDKVQWKNTFGGLEISVYF